MKLFFITASVNWSASTRSFAFLHTRAISIKTRANEFQRKYFLFQSNYSIHLYPAFKKNLNKSKDIVIARMSICSLMFLMEKFSFLSTVFVFASFSQPSEAHLNCWPCHLPSTWHIFFSFSPPIECALQKWRVLQKKVVKKNHRHFIVRNWFPA